MHSNNRPHHRQLIRLKGSIKWCYQQCEKLLQQFPQPYFWLGDCPEKITSTTYKQILGQETALLIINAQQQFDPNLFAASEGTLRGGGTLILICPAQIDSKDHFYYYIDQQLDHAGFLSITENMPSIAIELNNPCSVHPLHLEQQNNAINEIIKTLSGHRRRPLVLTANRGRGKSAALGLAAKQLVQRGARKILICAPSKNATMTLFKHAGDNDKIMFIAPDLLLSDKPDCDLLMIDEAAALPVSLLEEITRHYSRLVFATTLHGYEGSGRGFALRFQKRLQQLAPQFRSLHLDQPIRWDINDPLEKFTLQHLCLTEGNITVPTYDANKAVHFEVITTQQLLNDHDLLTELFSLLVTAHYQTKPSDLQMLLNDTDLSILALMQQQKILAVALVNHEGEIAKPLAMQILKGERRLKGHLVAQSLTFHCAQPLAATHKYARIQRIATHPALQQQGLGKIFIGKITRWAEQNQFDHLCAAFGATSELLRFWQVKQFQTLRIGCSKDKSSGTHSFIVNLPLSEKGQHLHQSLQMQFQALLSTQISRQLQQLDPTLILTLLNESYKSQYCHPLITSYCEGNLPYEFAEAQLITLILNSDLSLLAKNQQSLTIQKILQNRRWDEICQQSQYTGKKHAQQALRASINSLISTHEIEE